MLYQAPSLQDASDNDILNTIVNRPTPAGAYAGAVIEDSFWSTTPGAAIRDIEMPQDDRMVDPTLGPHRGPPRYVRTEVPVMSQDQWKESPWYREAIPFDDRMTEARAKYKAQVYDDNQYRSWLRQNRANGISTAAIAVGGSLLGAAPDPVNYIPFFGPAFKVAAATRLGNIMLRAGVGAADAAVGTALSEPLIIGSRRQFGDDVSFADALLDIGIGAALGGILGGAGGWRERLSSYHPELAQASVHNLSEAAEQMVDGRPIEVGPEARQAALKVAEKEGLAREPLDASPNPPWRREFDANDPLGSTQRFIQEAADPKVQKLAMDYGDISEDAVSRIAAETGVDVSGYRQILDAQGYRHIALKHGDAATEAPRGQLPVTAEDLSRIPEIVNQAQLVGKTEVRPGRAGLEFTFRAPDGTTFLVQEIRSGRRVLSPVSIYKWKAGSEPRAVREKLDAKMAADQTGHGKSPQAGNPGNEPNSSAVPAAEGNISPAAAENKIAELEPAFVTRQWDNTPLPQDDPELPVEATAKQVKSEASDLPEGAEDYGLDAEGMDLDNREIERLKAEGSISEEDAAALKEADEATGQADAYGKALETAASCLTRNP